MLVVSWRSSTLPDTSPFLFALMNTQTPALSPAQNARLMIKTLQENYPVFRDYSPLAIGIDKQLLTRQPELDRKVLRIALGMHTRSLGYLKTMEKATHRLDLDGNSGAEISPEHRTHAREILRERSKKETERRKAQREAEALAASERERTEKLSQLVEKFGKQR